jgi:hypothetical protein
VLYPVTYTISTNCTIPSNVSLQFSHGSCLAPADGTTTTITGYFTAPMSKIFCNAVAGHGTIRLASTDGSDNGGQALVDIYPEWWGASGNATGATNTPALQAAIIGAYGNNRINGNSATRYNRILHFSTLYSINAELRVYHMIGFRWEGENQFGSGLRQQACGLRIIDGQSIAYGRFENLRFENGCGGKSGAALVDVDYNGSQGPDLRPQNITFYDDFFAGNSLTDVGVLIAKSGGGAQGDNIRCYNCYFNGFTGAGWQVGGNNTGRNAGRYYAYNAIKEQITGGDCQNSPLYCIAVYGGSIEVDGISMEAESNGFGSQTGADVYCEGVQDRCIVRNVRSEDHLLAWGDPMAVEHSKTMFHAIPWYGFSGAYNWAGANARVGAFFTGTNWGGDGKYYKVMTAGIFGGLTATTATSGTLNSITVSTANWTAKGFGTSQQVTIINGTGVGQICQIVTNTGTTINCNGNWTTNYYLLSIVAPDSTSQFVVEPYWAGHPTTNGTVTFALFDFPAIQGALGNGCGDCLIEDVEVGGGTVQVGGISRVDGLHVSRSDWTGAAPFGNSLIFTKIKNVRVDIFAPNSGLYVNSGGTGHYRPWTAVSSYAGQAPGFPDWEYRGTQPMCWEYGQNGGGQMASDVCIGIRTDNGSLNSTGRAVLGIRGTVGPVTPFGTNQPGVDLPVSGGLSTGNGKPGGISFRLGASGGSSSSVNDSNEVARIDVNGYKLPAFTFAKLPAAPDGYVVFCVDCNPGCTAGSGKGRTCFRENGNWTH